MAVGCGENPRFNLNLTEKCDKCKKLNGKAIFKKTLVHTNITKNAFPTLKQAKPWLNVTRIKLSKRFTVAFAHL